MCLELNSWYEAFEKAHGLEATIWRFDTFKKWLLNYLLEGGDLDKSNLLQKAIAEEKKGVVCLFK